MLPIKRTGVIQIHITSIPKETIIRQVDFIILIIKKFLKVLKTAITLEKVDRFHNQTNHTSKYLSLSSCCGAIIKKKKVTNNPKRQIDIAKSIIILIVII